MNRQEYTARVLSCLRRLTAEEKAAALAEIDAHMEDRICALLDLGYDEALAEERTMAAMGDPEEVGREMDKQYPLRWLILGRAAVILTAILVVQGVMSLGILGNFIQSMEARIYPERNSHLDRVEICERVDYKAAVGSDILRVYRVSLGAEEGRQVAEVSLCTYDRIPGGIVSEDILNRAEVKNQRGESLWDGNGSGCWAAEWANRYAQVQPGDQYVTVEYDWYGEEIRLEIPLPGEVTP